LVGQEGTDPASSGQVFGDAPETQAPESVAVAAKYLAVLRAQWDALDGALAGEMIPGAEAES
jgi:hypothetical protein